MRIGVFKRASHGGLVLLVLDEKTGTGIERQRTKREEIGLGWIGLPEVKAW
jgi:hypothetical protein